MLAKSEIALLTVTVFGTLTAWLAGPHPSLVTPIYDEPSIACSAPATAFRGVRPSFGEEKASFEQVSRISNTFLNFRDVRTFIIIESVTPSTRVEPAPCFAYCIAK